MEAKDLTFGTDVRGDHALFIHRKHFQPDWTLDEQAQEAAGSGTHFFRVIDDEGEQSGHGWVDNGEIVQWG